MKLAWKQWVRLYWPYLALGGLALLTLLEAVFTIGYSNGLREIMHASFVANNEAKKK